MALFLSAFILIYGGFHIHFFLRVRAAFHPGCVASILLVVFLVAGLMAPIIMRVAEEQERELFARMLSIAGYYWMAFLLYFCLASLFVEIYNFIMNMTASRFGFNGEFLIPSAPTHLLISAIFSIILIIYGSYEANHIRTEFLVIHSDKIAKQTGRIRVVQISDVHIGGAAGGGHVPAIVRAIREASPDVVVSTGDLVDGRGKYVSEAAKMFREIKPELGKFAITGNHEFYLGLKETTRFMEDAGFELLRNRTKTLAGKLNLVGVDDHGGLINGNGVFSDRETLLKTNRNHFTILLKHRPVAEKETLGLFELQLSGHTHKGQIFPFNILTNLFFMYHSGDYNLPGGALLHVSRGAGVWGPPIRVLAPPEITVIDLLPE